MKILIALNNFKDCASAISISHQLKQIIKERYPEHKVFTHPVSDGGEGYCQFITSATMGINVKYPSVNALQQPMKGYWGITNDTAVFELAVCSGLEQLAKNERNPLKTSTYGTGLLIENALEAGYRKQIIGLGGSATNDAGCGIAHALGFEFLDASGKLIFPTPDNLLALETIVPPDNLDIDITVACDVTNPLLGPNGASYTYATQKGATKEMQDQLEAALTHLVHISERDLGKSQHETPGAGAAGGTAWGLMTFLNAKLASGFQIFNEYTDLESEIKNADLIITGEGCYDETSAQGKAAFQVISLALKHQKKVLLIAGQIKSKTPEGINSIEMNSPQNNHGQFILNEENLIQKVIPYFDKILK